MESFFASFFGILITLGSITLTIFIIIYFFRLANDARKLRNTLYEIKVILESRNKSTSVRSDVEKSSLEDADLYENQIKESQIIVGFNKIPIDDGSFLYFDSKNGLIPTYRIGIEVLNGDGVIPHDGLYKIQSKNEKLEVINGILKGEYYVESYKTNDGETIDIDCNRITGLEKGSRAYINNLPAQDGEYRLGLFKKVKVKDGHII